MFLNKNEEIQVLIASFSFFLSAKTYHEQIQIQDGSIGNSYEKIFSRFLNDTVTQVTVQDPYIRAFHQVSVFILFVVFILQMYQCLDQQFFTFL